MFLVLEKLFLKLNKNYSRTWKVICYMNAHKFIKHVPNIITE